MDNVQVQCLLLIGHLLGSFVYHEDGDSMFLRNLGEALLDCMTLL
jgi:hypothetical protein